MLVKVKYLQWGYVQLDFSLISGLIGVIADCCGPEACTAAGWQREQGELRVPCYLVPYWLIMQNPKKPRILPSPNNTEVLNVLADPESLGAALISQPTASDAALTKTTKSPNTLTFTWSELDIGYDCPNIGCEDSIPLNIPKALIDQFQEYAWVEHDGADQAVINKLEMTICVELGMFWVWDQAACMQ